MEQRLLAPDLYQYLLALQNILKVHGASDLARRVELSTRFASGSMTEFYTDAEEALTLVMSKSKDILSDVEVAELQRKLVGIAYEFKRIGGA